MNVALPGRQLRTMHLFAGAGGGIMADLLLGHVPVCAVEIEDYPRRVLLSRQRDGILPRFPIWDDVRTFDGRPWRGVVDVVSGGFPCQAFSTAARVRNNADDLSYDMCRIVSDVSPRFVFAENPSREAVNAIGDELSNLGYVSKAIALSASDLGADHIRQRYWLLAHADTHGELPPAIDAEAPKLSGVCQSVWQADPGEPRVANGMAYRMDRIGAIGNGQIPIVAALAWRILNG